MNHLDQEIVNKMTIESWAKAIKVPYTEWHNRCHEISLKIIRANLVGMTARIARGTAAEIGVHSWISMGNPYAEGISYVDPTRWSWVTPDNPHIEVTSLEAGTHIPQGHGNIWDYGRPPYPTGETVNLNWAELSSEAKSFLDIVGPLDLNGWRVLLNSPVGGWPSKEIITAADKDPRLSAYIPVDVIGMLTNLDDNYW